MEGMKKRKPERLATLNLTIKKRWFDMIASGKKKEEYRESNNRQATRLLYDALFDDDWRKKNPTVIFRNGYRMDSRALVVEVAQISLRRSVYHPEWGEVDNKKSHYVISLGAILAQGKYAEVCEKIRDTRRMAARI